MWSIILPVIISVGVVILLITDNRINRLLKKYWINYPHSKPQVPWNEERPSWRTVVSKVDIEKIEGNAGLMFDVDVTAPTKVKKPRKAASKPRKPRKKKE